MLIVCPSLDRGPCAPVRIRGGLPLGGAGRGRERMIGNMCCISDTHADTGGTEGERGHIAAHECSHTHGWQRTQPSGVCCNLPTFHPLHAARTRRRFHRRLILAASARGHVQPLTSVWWSAKLSVLRDVAKQREHKHPAHCLGYPTSHACILCPFLQHRSMAASARVGKQPPVTNLLAVAVL